jgi:hypothetical protein
MRAPVLVIGANGSMGRRYQAILRYLGIPSRGVDVETSRADRGGLASMSRGVILATPTPTHYALWRAMREDTPDRPDLPILCEKPWSTTLREVEAMAADPAPLAMMAQYVLLDPPRDDGMTIYDYFQSGADGVGWDCLTLLGCARGPVLLKQDSPTWRCTLNGRPLTLDEVLMAYVDLVARWLDNPIAGGRWADRSWISRAHRRAAEWMEAHA